MKKFLYGNHGGGLIKVPLTWIGALTAEYDHVVLMEKKALCFSNFLQIGAQTDGCTTMTDYPLHNNHIQYSSKPSFLLSSSLEARSSVA